MTQYSPEPLLLRILTMDVGFIPPASAAEAERFIAAGECGLAYDVLVFTIEDGRYSPSMVAMELIRQSALALGLVFPQYSTD